ncbi:putative [histone H3]-lysine(4) N-trimethyltransferase chromatin remodeling SET family [Dioscorea sansibarensis]
MGEVGKRSNVDVGSADALDGRFSLNAGGREGAICCGGAEWSKRPFSPRENGSGLSELLKSGWKEIGLESNETDDREEEPKSLDLYSASHEHVELPGKVMEEEHCEFTGLSPLRTTDGGGSSASIDIAGLLDGRREYNDCENGLLVSSALVAECPLEEIKGDAADVEEENFFMHVPADGEDNQIDEKHENLLVLNPEREKDELLSPKTPSKSSLDCARVQKDSGEGNTLSSEKIGSSRQVCTGEEGCHVSHVPRLVSCSVHGSEGDAVYSCPKEGSGQISVAVKDCSAEIMSLPIAQESGAPVIDDANLTCGKSVEPESGITKPNTIIVFRRANPRRAASTNNKKTSGKHGKLSQARGNARKRKEAPNSISSISTCILKIPLQHMTRKRTSSHKHARLTIWGAAENLAELFKNNAQDELCDSPIQIQNKNPRKGKSGFGRKKQNTGLGGRRSRVAKNKNPSLSHSADIVDNNCLETVFPVVVQSQASLNICSDGSLTNADCYIEVGLLKESSEVKYKFSENRCNDNLTPIKPKGHQGDKDLESTVTQDTFVENVQYDCLGISSQRESKAIVETIDHKQLMNPVTSPDSDVCHPVPSVNSEGATSVCGDAATDGILPVLKPTSQVDVNGTVMTSSEALPTHGSASMLDTQPFTKKGKKSNSRKANAKVNGSPSLLSESFNVKGKFHGPNETKKARKEVRKSSRHGHGAEKQDTLGRRKSSTSKFVSETTTRGSKGKHSIMESPMLEIGKLDYCEEASRNETDPDTCISSGKDLGNANSEAIHKPFLVTAKEKSLKARRGTKMGVCEGTACHVNATKNNKRANARKKESLKKSIYKNVYTRGRRKPNRCLKAGRGVDTTSETGDVLALAGSNKLSSDELLSSRPCPGMEDSHSLSPQVAWVLCDDCQKWRCISAELADAINETKCRWTCKDNKDKAFADCSIPQEKTDAQINAELGISEDEECSNVQPIFKGVEPSKLAVSPSASFKLIKSNLFLHRNRRTQNIDEVMVCHCKPPSNGGLGCGEECLNRILNIECVRGTCPCGDLCSNQQFQKRKYTQFEWFPCGKKGYGLKLLEGVSQGQFLIEYVGEVLDLATYEQRQKEYASRGQKHFYFMTLNGGEVIDACAKGNLGRFINHSCEPNCRTEKWMVNGEVCIGLFAVRDIKEGEEVTFDYNYVRVFGAAAKKCVCGSSECRGYIGGDPSNTEAIVHGDSDEEYPEPVIVDEDLDETISDAIGVKAVENNATCVETLDEKIKCSPANPKSEIQRMSEPVLSRPIPNPLPSLDATHTENVVDKALSVVQPSRNSTENVSAMQTEETMYRPTFNARRPLDVPPQILSAADRITSNKIKDKKEDKPTASGPSPHAKPSRSSAGLKKGRQSVKGLIPHKVKEVLNTTVNTCFEGVEEKLNELLDVDGGISKRKDATKGYLKLLFVTAAEGDNVRGCASQSIRDLSLILDALLKTKSRFVLTDVINKNGLQMLHNIMKQNRSNFNRIPIIRKLLKVLEFLASKGILTPEHMNKGPPCEGMESFRDSMLGLTKHNDIQVHQIARNFRDKWMPRSIKRIELSDRDDNMPDSGYAFCNWTQSSFRRWHDMGTRDSDAIVCVNGDSRFSCNEPNTPGETSQFGTGQPISGCLPFTDGSSAILAQSRKRKSRWDQPTDTTMREKLPVSNEDLKIGASKSMEHTILAEPRSPHEAMEQKPETDRLGNNTTSGPNMETSIQPNVDDDAPPGFGSLWKDNHSQISPKGSEAAAEVVAGHLQERYLSHLTVSYGIPLKLLEQLGTYDCGSRNPPNWAVAPGMPFHPFPPLPPYPRSTPSPAVSTGTYPTQVVKESPAVSCSNVITSNISGEKSACELGAGLRHCQTPDRGRWPSRVPKRKVIHPQKWNNKRFQRCWPSRPWEGNHLEMRSSSRIGISPLGVGNGSNGDAGLGIPDCERSNGGGCLGFLEGERSNGCGGLGISEGVTFINNDN